MTHLLPRLNNTLNRNRLLQLVPVLFSLVILSGCGGGSGAQTQTKPNLSQPSSTGYTGPAAKSSDAQNFQQSLWQELTPSNRCGQCHNESGQSPTFARTDDVNVAFEAINPYINLTNPDQSALVNKVAQGHNCWLASAAACGQFLTDKISSWSGESLAAPANSVQLRAPNIKEPGASKSFPADSSVFSNTVYPLLTQYCAGCHSPTAAFAQAPYFASADVNQAYQAAQAKINLDQPALSRLNQRLSREFHNCWDDCTSDGAAMLSAIESFTDALATSNVDTQWVASKALVLAQDGIVASSGGRFEPNAIAKYEFKTGSGSVAYDTSGVSPQLNLTLYGDVSWLGGWGLQFNGGKAQGQTAASRKLYDQLSATSEYSLEAWVAPANVTQEGPARIISYSGGTEQRNFTLGQTLYNYEMLNRSSVTNSNGMPALATADAAERLQATLQHVVVNYTPQTGRRIYVNGQFTDDIDSLTDGTLNQWDSTFVLLLGNEASNDRPWQGSIRQLVIHSRALTAEQIQANYDAGVGEKFFMLFSIGHLIDMPQTYVVFEVSQFDSYGYLFKEPRVLSLDANARPNNIPLKGMRIGLNGQEMKTGQAFSRLDLSLNQQQYQVGVGQQLSRLGAIVPLEKGVSQDEFFLTFEQLGSNGYSRVAASTSPLTHIAPQEPQPEIGLKLFNEINASMAKLTGIAPTLPAISDRYQRIEQQLPTGIDAESFVSSQQMAITQLAIGYCSALVDSPSQRSVTIPNINFDSGPSTSLNTVGRKTLIDSLYKSFVGPVEPDSMSSALPATTTRTELGNLLTKLIDDCPTCADTPARTQTLVKATCTAVLASAQTLLQ